MIETARIRATLQKLLRRRGYTVPMDLPPDPYFTVKRDRDADVLLVYRTDDEARVGVGVIRDVAKIMEEAGVVNAILLASGTTSSAHAAVTALMTSGKFLTIIPPSSLVYDIYEHHDVPRHRLLDPTEVHDLLQKMRLNLSQFPCIKMDDPMCRYLGGRPGDIFEITRIRPTVGYDIYYRKVVDNALE